MIDLTKTKLQFYVIYFLLVVVVVIEELFRFIQDSSSCLSSYFVNFAIDRKNIRRISLQKSKFFFSFFLI